jgi:pimeloyl-ACP methyl ester carboxylesterase
METRFVKTNGIQLQVKIAGPQNGKPVFLLHGFPDFWFCWEAQIEALVASGFRVITPDQRGYNHSDKPLGKEAYHQNILAADIVGLVDALGYDKVNLAGHDFGGVVAWSVATLYPERVEKLAIISAPHFIASMKYNKIHKTQIFKSWYIGFFQLPIVPERFLKAFNYRALLQNMPNDLSLEKKERYRSGWSQPNAMRTMLNWYRGLLAGMRDRDIEYGLIDVPTHIMWGTKDKYLEVGLADLSLKQCTKGRLTVFEDTGHWVMHERSREVSALLMKHFSTSEID